MEGIESPDKRKRSESGSDEEHAGKRSAVAKESKSEEAMEEPTLTDIYREILTLKQILAGLRKGKKKRSSV